MIICIIRSRLRVSMGLGTYPWTTEKTDNVVEAGSLLDDEQWHDVSVIRTSKNLNISVDGVSIWRNLSAVFMHMDMNRKVEINIYIEYNYNSFNVGVYRWGAKFLQQTWSYRYRELCRLHGRIQF